MALLLAAVLRAAPLAAAEPEWKVLEVPADGTRPMMTERFRVIRPGAKADQPGEGPVWLRFTARRLDGRLVMQAPAQPADPPQALQVDSLSPGLQAAVVRMPVGARWQVEVPYVLGPLRRNPRFQRGSTLVFDVERMAGPDSAP